MSLMASPQQATAGLMDPAVQVDPYPLYAELRRQRPVYRMPETGFYLVTRYRDVLEVLRDSEAYSNDLGSGLRPARCSSPDARKLYQREGFETTATLQRTDPPLHTRHRAPLDRAFRTSRVRELAPRLGRIVDALIDDLLARDEVEFVADFAGSLPSRVLALLLGVPGEDAPKLRRWSNAHMETFGMMLTPAQELAAAREIVAAQQYFAERFEERRDERRDDLLSDLLYSGGDDEPIPMSALQDLMAQVLTGGMDTTSGSLTEGLVLLAEHPQQASLLRQEPRWIPSFVEELLRYDSPVQGLMRRATRDLTVAGYEIPKNAIVSARYASANRDGEVFADPDRFDVRRENARRHLAFGAGIHVCPGAALARQELAIAFQRLLQRIDDIELLRTEDAPLFHPSVLHRRRRRLHVRLRPREVRNDAM